jgi:hypothetical protein
MFQARPLIGDADIEMHFAPCKQIRPSAPEPIKNETLMVMKVSLLNTLDQPSDVNLHLMQSRTTRACISYRWFQVARAAWKNNIQCTAA